jgi:hypothetical protein
MGNIGYTDSSGISNNLGTAVVDGLKGFPEAIAAVFPPPIVVSTPEKDCIAFQRARCIKEAGKNALEHGLFGGRQVGGWGQILFGRVALLQRKPACSFISRI